MKEEEISFSIRLDLQIAHRIFHECRLRRGIHVDQEDSPRFLAATNLLRLSADSLEEDFFQHRARRALVLAKWEWALCTVELVRRGSRIRSSGARRFGRRDLSLWLFKG